MTARAQASLVAITGAASGIGQATSVRLARDGWDVLGLGLDAAGLSRTVQAVQAVGGSCVEATVDVADGRAVDSLLDGVGRDVKALVNCAGVGVAATVVEIDNEGWDRVMRTNVTGVFVMCRALLPSMLERKSGGIVNISSLAGIVGLRSRAAYCASKAAVLGLTRAIAVDHADRGIRANAICPGTVETEWIEKIIASSPDPQAARSAMARRQLDGRMGSPEGIAAMVALLLSPDGRFFNGSGIVIDGGVTAA